MTRPFDALREKSTELFKFVRGIFSKKTLKKITEEFTNPAHPDWLKALSAGMGISIGIIPLWGLQTVAAIFVAVAFRLNKALLIIFSQVSFPPFLPLILFFSYRIGKHWTGVATKANINRQIWQYLYGSLTLAIIAGLTVGLLTYASLKLTKAIKQYHIAPRLKKILPAQ